MLSENHKSEKTHLHTQRLLWAGILLLMGLPLAQGETQEPRSQSRPASQVEREGQHASVLPPLTRFFMG